MMNSPRQTAVRNCGISRGAMRVTLAVCFAVVAVAPIARGADAPAKPSAAPTAPAEKAAATSQKVTLVKADKLKDALDKAKGKVVVLNLWATFCPPCVKEMPEFEAFHKSHSGKEVVFVSANCDDPKELNSTVPTFLTEKKISFPVVLVDSNPDDIGKALGVKWEGNLPFTLVYDASGKIVKTWEEDITAKDLSAVVDPLLAKKAPAK